MLTTAFAASFARAWIDAWNAHDVDRVLAHYADDFQLASPFIASIADVREGRLTGKCAIRAYWAEALRRMPDLQFRLLACFTGVDSVVIHYHGVSGPAAETLVFGPDGRVIRAYAHYL
ncbi:MAG: nuclear transport factor 2 family protein [Dokdonella sp.]|uniref:nuclear transport factor 2 family protein n=1 Tax=Dokdonella sp. TaxID=2291710 RepID=UPI003F819179